MLDVRALRQDPETCRAKLKVKGFDLDISRFELLENSRKRLQSETENLQSERNSKSRSIGKAKAAGEDIAPLVAAVGDLGDRLDEVKEQFAANQDAYQQFLREIPNVPDASVPPGADETDNVEIDRRNTDTAGNVHASIERTIHVRRRDGMRNVRARLEQAHRPVAA